MSFVLNQSNKGGEANMNPKKQYVKPELVIHGNVETLTKGGSQPGNLDANYPINTPFADLTFSPAH